MIFRHLGAKDFGVQNFFRPRQELLLQIPANMVNVMVLGRQWKEAELSRVAAKRTRVKLFRPYS